MSESDYTNAYYSAIRQHPVVDSNTTNVSFAFPKPSHNLIFHNPKGEMIGTMDFNGSAMIFEGNAEESSLVFIDWISKAFAQRLKEEYDRGYKDAQNLQSSRTTE
jgi:hypothetical protein